MKAFVQATPISGPASVGASASVNRATLEIRHVDDANHSSIPSPSHSAAKRAYRRVSPDCTTIVNPVVDGRAR